MLIAPLPAVPIVPTAGGAAARVPALPLAAGSVAPEPPPAGAATPPVVDARPTVAGLFPLLPANAAGLLAEAGELPELQPTAVSVSAAMKNAATGFDMVALLPSGQSRL